MTMYLVVRGGMWEDGGCEALGIFGVHKPVFSRLDKAKEFVAAMENDSIKASQRTGALWRYDTIGDVTFLEMRFRIGDNPGHHSASHVILEIEVI